jgi:hypothetical protein
MYVISSIAGITRLVSNVYGVSRGLYQLFDAIKNAPMHVLGIARDVQSLHFVLGSLQGLLEDLQGSCIPSNVLPILETLQQPLDHCLFALQQLQLKISKYTKAASDGTVHMRKWTAFRWQFTEKDASAWKENLISYKLALDVAVATANLWVMPGGFIWLVLEVGANTHITVRTRPTTYTRHNHSNTKCTLCV